MRAELKRNSNNRVSCEVLEEMVGRQNKKLKLGDGDSVEDVILLTTEEKPKDETLSDVSSEEDKDDDSDYSVSGDSNAKKVQQIEQFMTYYSQLESC